MNIMQSLHEKAKPYTFSTKILSSISKFVAHFLFESAPIQFFMAMHLLGTLWLFDVYQCTCLH